MKNVLILHTATGEIRQQLDARFAGRCRLIYREPNWDSDTYRAALAEAHVILGEPKNEDFPHCRNLEWMQSPSSGVNYYVQGGSFPKTATLTSTTGGYGRVLAEHMVAMALSLCRRLPEYHTQQDRHIWQWVKPDKQLEESTVLILGAGDIGTTCARFLRPMVRRIIGLRRTARPYPDCFDEMITLDRLDSYLGDADLILCALPHTPQTIGLLDEKRLRLMKSDAVLVNGGRGSLIDQDALCTLLQEGKFWGVGLEVTNPEPLPQDHPLWDMPRLIITPHAAGNTYSLDSPLYRKVWVFMADNLDRFLTGQPVLNQVDFHLGYCKN